MNAIPESLTRWRNIDAMKPFESLGIAGLDEYFGVWAVEETRFRAGVDRVNALDLAAHVASHKAAAGDDGAAQQQRPYLLAAGGIAIIHLRGTLMKQSSSLSNNTSTVFARRAIRQAATDSDVKGIMLVVDSPGGTVSGTDDLAADIEAAAQQKPLHAFVEDLAASAAIWAISPAAAISASPTSLIGSIGVFSVIEDLSGMAAREGVKVHVIKSGGSGSMKGAGVAGTEVTPAHLAEAQRIVDGLAEHFNAAIAKGRKMEIAKVRELADGRVHIAVEARKLGLIDKVSRFDDAMQALRRATLTGGQRAGSRKENAMIGQGEGPTAATLQELKAALPGSDAEFLMSCLERNLTLDAATKEHVAKLNEQRAASEKRAKDAEAATLEAKAELEKSKAAKPVKRTGVEPLGTRSGKGEDDEGGGGDDPVAGFDAKVREMCRDGKVDRLLACEKVATKHPELHKAYLLATNNGKRAQRLIEEKID